MKTIEALQVCQYCLYFKSGNQLSNPKQFLGAGKCHHSPPTQDGWPDTKATEWCGQWKGDARFQEAAEKLSEYKADFKR